MIGKIVGNYRITEKVGAGGVGEVYKAVDLMLARPVAIKVLRPEFASRSAVVERFRSEAQTLARLNHPNIATLFSFVRDEASLLMVMEYVEGTTLAKLVRGSSGMDVATALPLFLQALNAIGHAHELGIIHRDIKGSNLMLNTDGRIKVMDFGIARMIGSQRVTRHGHFVGTPDYMSPEQIRGDDTDARSDIYSLGVLLFEMLTGRVPFRVRSDYELMHAHVETPPPRPRDLAPDLPESLEDALLRALAKDPGERFPSTDHFRAALAGEAPADASESPAERGESTGEAAAVARKPAPCEAISTGDAETRVTLPAPPVSPVRESMSARLKRALRAAAPRAAGVGGAAPAAAEPPTGESTQLEPGTPEREDAWPEPALAFATACVAPDDLARRFTRNATALAVALVLIGAGVNAISHRSSEPDVAKSDAPSPSTTAASSDAGTPALESSRAPSRAAATGAREPATGRTAAARTRSAPRTVRSGEAFVIERGRIESEARTAEPEDGQNREWVIRRQ